jgi:hypothetical protein
MLHALASGVGRLFHVTTDSRFLINRSRSFTIETIQRYV